MLSLFARWLRVVLTATLLATVSLTAIAGVARGADDTPGANTPKGGFGLTSSWLPTTSPVPAEPGTIAHAKFWVTNPTKTPITMSVLPGTAVPGNNGALAAKPGVDERFPDVDYGRRKVTVKPATTMPIKVDVTIPNDLAPGVYMILAIVHPDPPKTAGNIHTQQEMVIPITFQVPGAIDASLETQFRDADGAAGQVATYHFPGLPQIQIASTGAKVLRVLNTSSTALYSYNEITSTQSPWPTAVFEHHTPGASNDLRTDVALYFPHLYRDYPIRWSPSPLGFGYAHLTAFSAYHPTPSTIAQASTSSSALVISPWYFFVVVLYLALTLLSLRRTVAPAATRQSGHRRQSTGRRGPVASARARRARLVVLAAVTVLTACFGNAVIIALSVLTAIAIAVAAARASGKQDPVARRRWLLRRLILAAVALLAGALALLFAILADGELPLAIGVVAGAGTLLLAAASTPWWNHERPAPGDPAGTAAPVRVPA